MSDTDFNFQSTFPIDLFMKNVLILTRILFQLYECCYDTVARINNKIACIKKMLKWDFVKITKTLLKKIICRHCQYILVRVKRYFRSYTYTHNNVKAPGRQQTIRRDVLASLYWYTKVPENAEKMILENIFPSQVSLFPIFIYRTLCIWCLPLYAYNSTLLYESSVKQKKKQKELF